MKRNRRNGNQWAEDNSENKALALIGIGIGVVGGVLGWMIAIAGLLPLTLGIMNGCILAPILRVPFKGSGLPPS